MRFQKLGIDAKPGCWVGRTVIWSLMANLRWWQVERIDPLKLTFERSTMEKWQHQCYVGWRKLLPQNWAGCKSDGQVILRSLRPPNRLTMNPLSTISSLAGLLFIAGILECFLCSCTPWFMEFYSSYAGSSTLNPVQSLGWWVGGQSFETSVALTLVSLFISVSNRVFQKNTFSRKSKVQPTMH